MLFRSTIRQATDAIRDTSASFRRACVVETMGRHCGYLALVTASRYKTKRAWVVKDLLAHGGSRVYKLTTGETMRAKLIVRE